MATFLTKVAAVRKELGMPADLPAIQVIDAAKALMGVVLEPSDVLPQAVDKIMHAIGITDEDIGASTPSTVPMPAPWPGIA